MGGPSEKSRRLYGLRLQHIQESSSIVQIEKTEGDYFIIESLQTGKTSINFSFYRGDEKIVDVGLSIEVSLIDSYEILGLNDRRIHTGASVRLIAQPKDTIGRFFNQAICGFTYNWKSRNEDILSLEKNYINPTAKLSRENCVEGVNCQGINSAVFYAANATALKSGTAEIEIDVSIKYKDGSRSQNVVNVVRVKIVDPIHTNLPTYIDHEFGRSDLQLMPPNSFYKLEVKRSINYQYTLLYSSNKKPIVNTCNVSNQYNKRYETNNENEMLMVKSNGEVFSNTLRGKATVLIEDITKNTEFQMVNLLVTPIHSIFVYNSYTVSILPLQAEQNLRVMFQDEVGRLFPEKLNGGNRLIVQSSDPSVIEVELTHDRDSILVKSKNLGTAIISVSLYNDSSIYDVFPITVGSIVQPESPINVHVGGRIKFSVTNEMFENSKTRWNSNDEGLMSINSTTGEATALNPGKVTIELTDKIKYNSIVNIFEVTKVSLSNDVSKVLTNIPEHSNYKEEYKFTVRFFANNQELTNFNNETKKINNLLSLNCEVDDIYSHLFIVTSEIETDPTNDKQSANCLIRMRKNYTENMDFP